MHMNLAFKYIVFWNRQLKGYIALISIEIWGLAWMEVREGNVVSCLLATIITTELSQSTIISKITTNVAPFISIIVFVEEEIGVGQDLDIVEDIDRVIQGVVTMSSIEEGDKEHILLEVLPTLVLADLNMISLGVRSMLILSTQH